ncbi:MAG: hypothetical protein U0R80_14085 [Nocardioidaceae bacterium]
MIMASPARLAVAASLLVLSTACSAEPTESDPDCTSQYLDVLSSSSWAGLKDEMLQYDERGQVASVRIQEEGQGLIDGRGQNVVRVVDLLSREGRRLVQVDVWRTDGGGWSAGRWSQCID